MMDALISRRLFLALPGAAWLAAAGCAITPAGVGGANATQLRFTFNLNGPVNPGYIYVVAIRVLEPAYGKGTGTEDPTEGPQPLIASGSKNGVIGGYPTHYVIYDETAPTLYRCYRFPTQAEASDPYDPNSPVDLIWPGELVTAVDGDGDVMIGSEVDPRPTEAGGTYGQSLGFTINTNFLNQEAGTTAVTLIQFNILTMNVTANYSPRVIDAIGNQSNVGGTFVNPVQVDLTTSQTVTDQTAGVPETIGDTFGGTLPSVDLTSWALQITTP